MMRKDGVGSVLLCIKKGHLNLGLPWEIEVHVITTLLSADWQARSGRPAGGDATRLLFSQVAYLIHDNLDILMVCTVLVGPGIRSDFSCKENLLTFLEKIPRNDLLVVVELLLEDDAAEEASLLAALGEVLGERESCESLSFVRCPSRKITSLREGVTNLRLFGID